MPMKKRNNISVLEKLEASKLRGGEKIKGKRTVLIVVIILAIAVSAMPAQAWKEEPSYPASVYIDTIWPWDTWNGVSIQLTPTGWTTGTYWDGAYHIAGYTISEYERLAGPWPYNKRDRLSVAAEIWFHCVYIDPTEESIEIGFSEWWWD